MRVDRTLRPGDNELDQELPLEPRAEPFDRNAERAFDVLGAGDRLGEGKHLAQRRLEAAEGKRLVLFAERLRLMLDEDEPTFANWDQDATAVESDYGSQDPTTVAVELIEAAGTIAGVYAGVAREDRQRRGTRSNGDVFTVESLGSYHLHDVVHHLHDVGAP